MKNAQWLLHKISVIVRSKFGDYFFELLFIE